ncbi:pyrroline-5-carboxylate reductase 2-like isoform X2 [Watersipora subatra]
MGAKTTQCNRTLAENMEILVLAVKPNMVRKILRDVYPTINKDHLVVSIAAGISIATLQQELPAGSRVVRMMPNTPALVQCGATVFARGANTLPVDGEIIQNIVSTFGICEEMPEKHMDAVTGLSGSGPAFMFMALEALTDGGVKMGLSRESASRLAAQTMIGSAKMVMDTRTHPGELKDSVCSPSGSTISGVFELENAGFRSALLNAVQSASKRAYEIGLTENYDTAIEASRDQMAFPKSRVNHFEQAEPCRMSHRHKKGRRNQQK